MEETIKELSSLPTPALMALIKDCLDVLGSSIEIGQQTGRLRNVLSNSDMMNVAGSTAVVLKLAESELRKRK